jgi:cysteinyl-tRNA synthetase
VPLRLWNTLTGSLEPLVPIRPGQVGIYVCGPTVYDHAHIGHARSAVFFDVVVRFLRFEGYAVRYVRNFTDLDDKILEGAGSERIEAWKLADRYIRSYREDMAALGVLAPDVEPRVTEHIEPIRGMIARLVRGGHAYVRAGDVYHRFRSQGDCGRLATAAQSDLATVGFRVIPAEGKEDARDFVLWKKADDDGPAWESPWGRGRPGWHIECVAMGHRHLGSFFDIHGGGRDLVFPHHENERILSNSLAGTDLARYWIHHELVTVNGRKLSKSENFQCRIRDLRRGHGPMAIRMFLLSTHYRRPVDFTERRLDEAASALERLCGLAGRCGEDGEGEVRVAEGTTELGARFREAMHQDFNIPGALALLFASARRINRSLNAAGGHERLNRQTRLEMGDLLFLCRNILGILPETTAHGFSHRSAGLPASSRGIPLCTACKKDEERIEKRR